MSRNNTIVWTVASIFIMGCIILTILFAPLSTHGTKDILQSLHSPGPQWTLQSSDIKRNSLALPQGSYHATHTYSSHDAVIDEEHLYEYVDNITRDVDNIQGTIRDNAICYPSVDLSNNVCEGHFDVSVDKTAMFGQYDDKTVYITMSPDIDNPNTMLLIVSVGEKWTPEKDKVRN